METKFISSAGSIPLSGEKISVQENNSRVSDTMFTKYTLPFEFYATQEFLRKYGDYVSYETTNLQNKIPGYFMFENKVHEADLFIQSIEGYKITAQIDFGFEELPNFSKKLSELPLEKFDVADIYSYATSICKKKWPETNFNFPRIYTEAYSPDSDPWKNFDGYYNDLKKDGSEMRRNYIDGDGNVFNVNIIHPCPHMIYLLKRGFEDAGFQLAGDVLTDPNFQQKWVFSGTEYFSRLTQRRLVLQVGENEFDYIGFLGTSVYNKSLTVEKKGNYRIKGFFNSRKIRGSNTGFIVLNGIKIWSFNSDSYDIKDYWFDFNVNIAEDNTVLNFYLNRVSEDTSFGTVIQAELVGKELDLGGGEDNGVITNLNQIDLTKAVPDITFGDFVNVIKNWFNYDIDIDEKTVYMNRIGEVSNVKDFKFLEVPTPKRTLLNKKSFLIKFTDLDNDLKKDSMYYDSSGQFLNGTEKTDTNIIEINGYLMWIKLPKAGGYNTAFVAKERSDTVALVEYSGLQNGQNNATYTKGCDFPELFDNYWLKFLRQRINGQEFDWQKYCKIEQICRYSIKDYIFAYNNIHIIKSISKDQISEDIYEVEIITETVV